MKISVKKNIVALIAFVAILVMFLIYRFSIAGAISTVVIVGLIALKRFSKKYEDNIEISPYLGIYFSGALFEIALIEVLYFMNEDFFNKFDKYSQTNYWTILIWVLISYGATAVLLPILDKIASKSSSFFRVIKHAGLFFINLLFLSLIFDNDYFELNNVLFCSSFGLIFYIADLFSNRVCKAETGSVGLFAVLTSASLMVCGCLHPKFTRVYIVESFLNSAKMPNWNWYIVLIIGVIFVLAAICFFAFDNDYFEKDGDFTFTDSANVLLIGFNIVAYALTINHYSSINYVFYLMILVIDIVVLLVPSGTKKKDDLFYKVLNNKLIMEVVLIVSWVILFFTHIHGTMDIAFIVLLIVALNVIFPFSKWVCSISIIFTGALSAVMASHWHSSTKVYIFIAVFSLVLAILSLALSFNNKAFEKNDMGIPMQYLISVLALIVLLSAFSHTGIKVTTKVDNEIAIVDEVASQSVGETKDIMVTLKPKGKDNTVSSCVYYWTSNKEKTASPKLDENNSFVVKNASPDTLVIVCTDKNGIVSTYRHIFNIK